MSFPKHLARVVFLAGIVGPPMNPARADGPPAPDGQFRLGIEYEYEKSADGRQRADALTLIPGIKWRSGWLTMTELLIETEQEREAGRVTDRADQLGVQHHTLPKITRHRGVCPQGKIIFSGIQS